MRKENPENEFSKKYNFEIEFNIENIVFLNFFKENKNNNSKIWKKFWKIF